MLLNANKPKFSNLLPIKFCFWLRRWYRLRRRLTIDLWPRVTRDRAWGQARSDQRGETCGFVGRPWSALLSRVAVDTPVTAREAGITFPGRPLASRARGAQAGWVPSERWWPSASGGHVHLEATAAQLDRSGCAWGRGEPSLMRREVRGEGTEEKGSGGQAIISCA